jgi:hypothetical protein
MTMVSGWMPWLRSRRRDRRLLERLDQAILSKAFRG